MKTHVWVSLPFVLAVAASWSACGGSSSNPSTGGQTTTSSHTVHTTTTSSTTTTSTATALASCDSPTIAPSGGSCYTIPVHTPPASCKAMDGGTPDAGTGASDAGTGDGGAFVCAGSIANANDCGVCVEGSCCAQLAACNAVANCWDCLTDANADPTTCAGTDITNAINAISDCQTSCCQDTCNPGCNPVTNAGCDAANGEGCDIDLNNPGGYTCFTNDSVTACQMCDESNGPFCGAGLTCLSDDSCGAFCCTDADCGTGKCDKTQLPSETVIGVCVHK